MNNDIVCRFCGPRLNFVEAFYPPVVHLCHKCLLVQLQEIVAPDEAFPEYSYFSAYSDAWLDHAERYVEPTTARFGLGPMSRVIGLDSNDGHLRQFFVQFDQIYHEHFSYFIVLATERTFTAQCIRVFDVEEPWTHGGSLRIYAYHAADESRPRLPAVFGVAAPSARNSDVNSFSGKQLHGLSPMVF